jgi:hypothetical protein
LAERAAGLVRAGVDSPPESRLRMLILLAGLPEPSVNYIIRDQDTGEWLRRFELAYEELRIAIEYEGRQHRTTTRSGRRTSTGARTWTDGRGEWFKASPPACSTTRSHTQRIDQARVDRGAAPTRSFTEEWRRYFSGRDVA